jgi:hypothetical protein
MCNLSSSRRASHILLPGPSVGFFHPEVERYVILPRSLCRGVGVQPHRSSCCSYREMLSGRQGRVPRSTGTLECCRTIMSVVCRPILPRHRRCVRRRCCPYDEVPPRVVIFAAESGWCVALLPRRLRVRIPPRNPLYLIGG